MSAANLDSDPHHCPGRDPARLSPTANRSRAFCLSGHEQPLCRVKSPSRPRRFSAITLRQVGTCHQALELKGADSGTAGELGAQPGPHLPPLRGGVLCQDTAWRWLQEAPVSLPFAVSTLEGSLSSESRTETLPATCLPPYGDHLKTRHFSKEALGLFIPQAQS